MALIYTNENNPATLKLLISSNYGKQKVDLKIVTLQDRILKHPKHLPYLELEDGRVLFSSNAAARYLFPSTNYYPEVVDEWLEWETTVLVPSIVSVGSGTKTEKQKKLLNSCLKRFDTYMQGKRFILEHVSVADVAIWSTLYPYYKEDGLKEFANLSNYMKLLEEKGEFEDALKQFKVNGLQAYGSLVAGSKYLTISSPSTVSCPVSEISPQQIVDLVSIEELELTEKTWNSSTIPPLSRHDKDTVILPKPGKKNILITSALPYVNNVPHLGNIIGCVLSADVFARFSRLCGYPTVFLCGTDEYGTATETKALEEGLSCREICDKFFKIHSEIYQWFNISFDHFGRTSTPQQTELCQEMFLRLNENGFMFVDTVEQLHCSSCNRYLADRFVEGGCPHLGCLYADARGDQCDGCGKLVNAIELKNPRCKICGNTPSMRKCQQFFIDLPKLEPLLLHWMKKSAPGWSSNAQVIGRSWMREGLKARCITRDLKWGVSVPVDGFREKVFYVWFDAPLGYMSITKNYTDQWEQWWRPKPGTDVTLYQFMAKDNVPFHAVMFPATLLGANRGYITVSHIMATEYLNYEDGKFSKSRGVGVFGNDAQDTGIPSDVWRFYLLYVRPESQDASFSWADLATKNNSELLNNLGNFINRALVFAKNNFAGVVPEMQLTKVDFYLLALCTKEYSGYVRSLEKGKLRDGIRHILSISRHGNQYMQTNQPWVLLKGSDADKSRAGTIIGVCCNLVCLLTTLLHPYMPDTSSRLQKQLNTSLFTITPDDIKITKLLPSCHKMNEPEPLFVKIEPSRVEELKKLFAGKQSENGKVQNNDENDVASLEAAVAEQGKKVRELKASGAGKDIWQPEVQKLLDLKLKLAETEKDTKPNETVEPSLVKADAAADKLSNGVANPQAVKQLEEDIEKQGAIVRKLKSSSEKSVWQPEVEKLLEMKNKLAAASGNPVVSNKKEKKGRKK